MKKVLFDQIFTVMKEIGIKPMLGTRTNVKRHPNVKHFGNFEADEKRIESVINHEGVERVLKMFETESGFIPQMNDQEGRMFLKNLNKLRPLINPPENVIPGPGSKAQETTKKIIEDEQGVGSLFKENTDTRVVDVVDDLKTLEEEAGNLESSMQTLKSLAFRLTPEYEAQKKAAHQAWMKRAYEGKGFDGREGYFRAVVRPFLIDQHKKGIINIPDDHLKSLKESTDLSSGGGAEDSFPDPVRMFRHYYGEEAFDKIPDNIDSPATSSILEAFATDVNTFKPIKTTGPQTGMGYQTKGELLARIEERQKLINDIRRGDEWPISEWTKDHKLETIASTRLQIEGYQKLLDKYYPGSSTPTKSTKLWDLVDEKTGKIDDDWDPDIGGMAQGGRVGLVKGGVKKGIESLIKKLNEKLGKDTVKKASDLPKGTKYEELEAVKAFEERNPIVNIWEDPVKVRAAVDDIFSTGDYKMDAEMAAEALVENNPTAFGGKLIDDIDDATRSKIYGAVLEVVQRDLGKQLQLKRAARKSKGQIWKDEKGDTEMIAMGWKDDEMKSLNQAFIKGKAMSDAMKKMGYDTSSGKSTIAFDEAVAAGMEGFPREIKEQVIRAKYGDIVDKRLLENMLADDNHFRLAEVFATIEQGLKMQEQGMGGEQIVEAIKSDLKRKPNAAGGGVGSMFREV